MALLATRGDLRDRFLKEGFDYLAEDDRAEDFIDQAALDAVNKELWPERLTETTISGSGQTVAYLGPITEVRRSSDQVVLAPERPKTLRQVGVDLTQQGVPMKYWQWTGDTVVTWPLAPTTALIVQHYTRSPYVTGDVLPAANSAVRFPIEFLDAILMRAKALAFYDNNEDTLGDGEQERYMARINEARDKVLGERDEPRYVRVSGWADWA